MFANPLALREASLTKRSRQNTPDAVPISYAVPGASVMGGLRTSPHRGFPPTGLTTGTKRNPESQNPSSPNRKTSRPRDESTATSLAPFSGPATEKPTMTERILPNVSLQYPPTFLPDYGSTNSSLLYLHATRSCDRALSAQPTNTPKPHPRFNPARAAPWGWRIPESIKHRPPRFGQSS